jgi:hypothetical protein
MHLAIIDTGSLFYFVILCECMIVFIQPGITVFMGKMLID